jgi:hypothetical protein
MKHFKLNQRVRVSPKNDNDNYASFRNEVLIITHVAKDINDHAGYDESVSPEYLYDLKTESGKDVNCSLYDYELIPA